MVPRTISFGKQIAYSFGNLGIAALVNVLGLQLVYFYLPPESAELPDLISQVTFLGILNVITLIAASGRLLDGLTDPLVALLSDRSANESGRRIPFMKLGLIPATLFCLLMFVPPVRQLSDLNIVWLVVVQALFYIFLTIYATPYYALLPELGHTRSQRLDLSTWISVAYSLGIVLAAQVPLTADILQDSFGFPDRITAIQIAIGIIATIAMLTMLVPIIFINEKRDCPETALLPTQRQEQDLQTMQKGWMSAFKNPHFRFYLVAAFTSFVGLGLIGTGLLFYMTVLLGQQESIVGGLLALMVMISLGFYPVVNMLAKKLGKKALVVLSTFMMGLSFLVIAFLGYLPLPLMPQAYIVISLFAIPLSFLSVLPTAILSDIVNHDALQTGQRREAMFFASRMLTQKFGQTFGILLFAALTTLGKDAGDDLGIRLSGFVGFTMCIVAGIAFTYYNEEKLLGEIAQLEGETA